MRGLADEVIENEGGASRLDLLQQALDARVAEGQVALPQHPAVYVANQVAGNAVQLPPPDVIGTEQEGIAPEARYDEVQQRDNVLIRAGVRIDYVVVGLEALVGTGIPEKTTVLFQERYDFLAAPGGGAAEDVLHPLVPQELHAVGAIALDLSLGIALPGAQQKGSTGIGVDGFDGRKHALSGGIREKLIVPAA